MYYINSSWCIMDKSRYVEYIRNMVLHQVTNEFMNENYNLVIVMHTQTIISPTDDLHALPGVSPFRLI